LIIQYDIKDDSDDEVTIDLEAGYGHNCETTFTTLNNELDGPISGKIVRHAIGKNNRLKKKKIVINSSVDLTDTGNNNAVISIRIKGGADTVEYSNIMPAIKDDTTAHFNVMIYFY
jgi:hypothetical protein